MTCSLSAGATEISWPSDLPTSKADCGDVGFPGSVLRCAAHHSRQMWLPSAVGSRLLVGRRAGGTGSTVCRDGMTRRVSPTYRDLLT